MVKEKACKKCKLIVEGPNCPICKGNEFANVIQGKINFIDINNSIIGQKMEKTHNGRYAIKIR